MLITILKLRKYFLFIIISLLNIMYLLFIFPIPMYTVQCTRCSIIKDNLNLELRCTTRATRFAWLLLQVLISRFSSSIKQITDCKVLCTNRWLNGRHGWFESKSARICYGNRNPSSGKLFSVISLHLQSREFLYSEWCTS